MNRANLDLAYYLHPGTRVKVVADQLVIVNMRPRITGLHDATFVL
jgi:hypothetical protein